MKTRHWLLASFPLVVCLAIVGVIQYFGGYQAVRIRGFTRKRISILEEAERAAYKCVGLRFTTAKRAFNDDQSWRLFTEYPPQGGACDVGRLPRKGPGCEVWMYEVNSSDKIMLFVEDGIVVGAAGN